MILLAGLNGLSADALIRKLPKRKVTQVRDAHDPQLVRNEDIMERPPLIWGRDRIGIGLLLALRARSPITFEDQPSPLMSVKSKSGHLVVCEEGNELAQVIAANYAFSLGAGLHLVQETSRRRVDEIMERFYSKDELQDKSPSQVLTELREQLRGIAGEIPVPTGGSITFISGGLPFGFAFSEVPSTHLFIYPDLGIAILNGFSAEQDGSRGVQVATLVNPETTPAPEIDAAARILADQQLFVRVYQGPGADVTTISEMIELFPYDLLIIATHCGDVPGHRWTYEFTDSEGLPRVLVVDIALGIGQAKEKDLLHVTQFIRFVSLDGVAWDDEEEKSKLYVGTAMNDFVNLTQSDSVYELKPTIKETVPRVLGSAAMKMHDNNLIAIPRSVGSEGTPIIINNACVSWHRLAGDFMFGGARSYVGTLFPISTTEAEEVLLRALGKNYGKMIPHAFWSAQREVYGTGFRRPYVVAGIYTQRIRATPADTPKFIASELKKAGDSWKKYRDYQGPHADQRKRTVDAHIEFFERELRWFQKRYS